MTVQQRPYGFTSHENDLILAMVEQRCDFGQIGKRLERSAWEIETQLGRIRKLGVAQCSISGDDPGRKR